MDLEGYQHLKIKFKDRYMYSYIFTTTKKEYFTLMFRCRINFILITVNRIVFQERDDIFNVSTSSVLNIINIPANISNVKGTSVRYLFKSKKLNTIR